MLEYRSNLPLHPLHSALSGHLLNSIHYFPVLITIPSFPGHAIVLLRDNMSSRQFIASFYNLASPHVASLVTPYGKVQQSRPPQLACRRMRSNYLDDGKAMLLMCISMNFQNPMRSANDSSSIPNFIPLRTPRSRLWRLRILRRMACRDLQRAFA